MDHPTHARAARLDRVCLGLAFAIPIVWFFIYGFQPAHLVDEGGHADAVIHILERRPGWPEHMTMLPGYHDVVVTLWQLGVPLPILPLARLTSMLFALLGVAAFALAWRQLHGRPAGRAALLFSLLPLLQPFGAMAYSDMPAIALVLLATGMHERGHRFLAALAFAEAAFVRQTNLLWAACLVSLEGFGIVILNTSGAASWGLRARTFFRRTGWLLLLLAAASVIVLKAGRVTLGTQIGAAMSFNIATVHCGALLVTLLGAPVWISGLPWAWAQWCRGAKEKPAITLGLTALGLGAAAVFALTYANPHGWNRELFWSDATFTLLRNWPLVWIDQHPWLRVASGLNVVSAGLALLGLIVRQPRHAALTLSLVFGAMLPAANSLVEPRYFIPMAVFLLFWSEIDNATARNLALWWAGLCVVHTPFIVRGLSLW